MANRKKISTEFLLHRREFDPEVHEELVFGKDITPKHIDEAFESVKPSPEDLDYSVRMASARKFEDRPGDADKRAAQAVADHQTSLKEWEGNRISFHNNAKAGIVKFLRDPSTGTVHYHIPPENLATPNKMYSKGYLAKAGARQTLASRQLSGIAGLEPEKFDKWLDKSLARSAERRAALAQDATRPTVQLPAMGSPASPETDVRVGRPPNADPASDTPLIPTIGAGEDPNMVSEDERAAVAAQARNRIPVGSRTGIFDPNTTTSQRNWRREALAKVTKAESRRQKDIETAAQRLAAGEIDQEQHDAIVSRITGSRAVAQREAAFKATRLGSGSSTTNSETASSSGPDFDALGVYFDVHHFPGVGTAVYDRAEEGDEPDLLGWYPHKEDVPPPANLDRVAKLYAVPTPKQTSKPKNNKTEGLVSGQAPTGGQLSHETTEWMRDREIFHHPEGMSVVFNKTTNEVESIGMPGGGLISADVAHPDVVSRAKDYAEEQRKIVPPVHVQAANDTRTWLKIIQDHMKQVPEYKLPNGPKFAEIKRFVKKGGLVSEGASTTDPLMKPHNQTGVKVNVLGDALFGLYQAALIDQRVHLERPNADPGDVANYTRTVRVTSKEGVPLFKPCQKAGCAAADIAEKGKQSKFDAATTCINCGTKKEPAMKTVKRFGNVYGSPSRHILLGLAKHIRGERSERGRRGSETRRRGANAADSHLEQVVDAAENASGRSSLPIEAATGVPTVGRLVDRATDIMRTQGAEAGMAALPGLPGEPPKVRILSGAAGEERARANIQRDMAALAPDNSDQSHVVNDLAQREALVKDGHTINDRGVHDLNTCSKCALPAAPYGEDDDRFEETTEPRA